SNLRPSRNYNKCIGIAESDFIVLMGCDDLMKPGYVARVLDLIDRHPDVDIIQPGVDVVDENGAPSRPLADRVKSVYRFRDDHEAVYRGEELARSLLRGNWTYFPSLVWRRERLTAGFRE